MNFFLKSLECLCWFFPPIYFPRNRKWKFQAAFHTVVFRVVLRRVVKFCSLVWDEIDVLRSAFSQRNGKGNWAVNIYISWVWTHKTLSVVHFWWGQMANPEKKVMRARPEHRSLRPPKIPRFQARFARNCQIHWLSSAGHVLFLHLSMKQLSSVLRRLPCSFISAVWGHTQNFSTPSSSALLKTLSSNKAMSLKCHFWLEICESPCSSLLSYFDLSALTDRLCTLFPNWYGKTTQSRKHFAAVVFGSDKRTACFSVHIELCYWQGVWGIFLCEKKTKKFKGFTIFFLVQKRVIILSFLFISGKFCSWLEDCCFPNRKQPPPPKQVPPLNPGMAPVSTMSVVNTSLGKWPSFAEFVGQSFALVVSACFCEASLSKRTQAFAQWRGSAGTPRSP